MCGPKFCSMRITEEVRELAARQEVEAGLAAKAAEFREGGGRIYKDSDDHHH
jgi:phosphomethylpyrimidine synthase